MKKMSPWLRLRLLELVDALLTEKRQPADRLFERVSAEHKLGSRDRRALSLRFYGFLRNYWKCVYLYAMYGTRGNRRKSMMDRIYAMEEEGPSAKELIDALELMGAHDASAYPVSSKVNMHPEIWRLFKASFPDEQSAMAAATYSPPTVDIRVNTFAGVTKSAVIQHLCAKGILVDELPYDGLRLGKRCALARDPLYQAGAFEVQDFASQVVARLCEAGPGMRVLDFCAGEGGKAIAMLNDSQGKARVTLADVNERRLERARDRIGRIPGACVEFARLQAEDVADVAELQAGEFAELQAGNVADMQPAKFAKLQPAKVAELQAGTFVELQPGTFDLVVVDAPCSGMGTFRRNPDKTVHLRASDVFEYAELQRKILQRAAAFVKKGGRLVYITCSYFKAENEDVVNDFVNATPGAEFVDMRDVWRRTCSTAIPHGCTATGVRLEYTDGFFVASLRMSTQTQ
ncbi:MAG: RsmB/NOP family class I SAM-dependent RNA methyltransferase [Holosporales bacterium]|nr:RsmB/NOP family class I SAM-dependent RNA methyltransferase [Holosporales bacterium]